MTLFPGLRPIIGMILIATAELVFILAFVYIFKVRNTFASIPRLEKPWIVLEGGVALLFIGVLLNAIRDAMSIGGIQPGFSGEFAEAIITVSAIFILAAMVMMKRAWTVTERE
jgi:hypothetical protein